MINSLIFLLKRSSALGFTSIFSGNFDNFVGLKVDLMPRKLPGNGAILVGTSGTVVACSCNNAFDLSVFKNRLLNDSDGIATE